MLQVSNLTNAMETRNHFKNGANSKSQTSRRNFLKIVLTVTAMLFTIVSFAQEIPDYRKGPKQNERVIGSVTSEYYVGSAISNYTQTYKTLLEKAKTDYPDKVVDLRNVEHSYRPDNDYYVICSAKVVDLGSSPETKLNETLVKAVDKAMSKVRAGSRLAIDQISVTGSALNRETVNDQLIDVLLDNGYKVVAKEYLERLKEEQEQQMKGGHNERTTVQTDNFSGVGYFLNVRVNEKSIRVQVINVSTGEYEGNATVEF